MENVETPDLALGGDKSELVEVLPTGVLKRRLGGRERVLVEPGQTIGAMLASLELKPQSVIVMINGRRASKEYRLQPGDQAKLLRLITGG